MSKPILITCQPDDQYFIWQNHLYIESCLDNWPSIGCEIWLDEAKTLPFSSGTYTIQSGICIVIDNGVIINII